VNVDNAVSLCKMQLESYENTWPSGFHETIPRTVNTMALSLSHKPRTVCDVKVYGRAMGLMTSCRTLDTNNMYAHELAPHPTSMFDTNGRMCEAKARSNLKTAFKVKVSSQLSEQVEDALFLDGCAVLWVVPWPAAGTVFDRMRSYLHSQMMRGDVYLIFDR